MVKRSSDGRNSFLDYKTIGIVKVMLPKPRLEYTYNVVRVVLLVHLLRERIHRAYPIFVDSVHMRLWIHQAEEANMTGIENNEPGVSNMDI